MAPLVQLTDPHLRDDGAEPFLDALFQAFAPWQTNLGGNQQPIGLLLYQRQIVQSFMRADIE